MVLAANAFLFSRVGETFAFLGPVFSFSTGEICRVLAAARGRGGLVVGLIGSTLALRRFLEV